MAGVIGQSELSSAQRTVKEQQARMAELEQKETELMSVLAAEEAKAQALAPLPPPLTWLPRPP